MLRIRKSSNWVVIQFGDFFKLWKFYKLKNAPRDAQNAYGILLYFWFDSTPFLYNIDKKGKKYQNGIRQMPEKPRKIACQMKNLC